MAANNDVIVQTTHGAIRGAVLNSVYGDSYYSFERIPFAKPPLGELRFKAPVPASCWTQVLDCTQKAQKPLQKDIYSAAHVVEGSEDCLYLNVYAKRLQSQKPLPVLVSIYGGGFEKGDPTRDVYGPDYFMMKDVILVTIAYRVGSIGFLSLPDPALDVPGNAGLKDQLLGLQWLSQNAANFNGDPNNVTLFGESAGGASTQYLTMMPQARGLFHKAIFMSGTVLCPWALQEPTNLPLRLAQALGFKGQQPDVALLQFLRAQPGEKLMEPELLTDDEKLNDAIFAFGPVVEPYASDHCVLPKEPAQLLAQSWGNEIPVMLGGTSFEGLLMYARVKQLPFLLTSLKDNLQYMVPKELKLQHDLATQRKMGELLKQVHFGDKDFTLQNLLSYCDYVSYKVFWLGIWQTVEARLRYARAPTYLYRFDFDSPTFNQQRIKYVGRELRGVAHVDDRCYLFYNSGAWKLPADSAEFKTIQRMIDIWTTYAASSNPNCPAIGVDQQGEDLWQPVSKGHFKCLNISNELEFKELPEMEKLKVWLTLFEKRGK